MSLQTLVYLNSATVFLLSVVLLLLAKSQLSAARSARVLADDLRRVVADVDSLRVVSVSGAGEGPSGLICLDQPFPVKFRCGCKIVFTPESKHQESVFSRRCSTHDGESQYAVRAAMIERATVVRDQTIAAFGQREKR